MFMIVISTSPFRNNQNINMNTKKGCGCLNKY